MSIDLVEEMRSDGRSFVAVNPPLRENEQAAFLSEWQETRAEVEPQVTADTVRKLSRWAKPQMQDFVLPVDWLSRMPMLVVGASSDQTLVRFGPKTADGLPLPSHSPLVFRYLVVYADFDRQAQRIVRVMVTIRGWVEE